MKINRLITFAALSFVFVTAPLMTSGLSGELNYGQAIAKGKGGGKAAGKKRGGRKWATTRSKRRKNSFRTTRNKFKKRTKSARSSKSKLKAATLKTKNKHGKLIGKDRAEWARDFASDFKGLNAHRASAQAYANANSKSQVGAIADYAAAEQKLRDAQQAGLETSNHQQLADEAWIRAARQGQDQTTRTELNKLLETRGFLSDPSASPTVE